MSDVPQSSPKLDYETLFNSAPGAYLVLDTNFRIVGVTEAYLAATMTERAAIVGRLLFDVFPDNPDDPNADGSRKLRASLETVLASKKPHRMAIQKYDIRRPASEGGEFEERYWSPINTPVLTEKGNIVYITHSAEDVTEFVRIKNDMAREQDVLNKELVARALKIEAETFLKTEAVEVNKRLQESERRYRFLADAIPQLIWTADAEGLLDYCNERWSAFTGLKFDDLKGKGWIQTIHADDLDHVRGVLKSTTEQYQIEHRMRYYDGSWRWVLTMGIPFKDSSGAIHKWFGTTTDIHDRKLAQEELREAQRMQAVGELAGGMAHEVNNMMSAVLGFGDLVMSELGPDHPQWSDVDQMVKAGQRSAKVTRQLLAFSRQQVMQEAVLDVNNVLDELSPTLQRIVGSDREFIFNPAPSSLCICADRNQLEQVLINLVANARDATSTDSVVEVTVGDVTLGAENVEIATVRGKEINPGPYVTITVSDNGMGMPEEVIARAFDPFFTTKPVGQGTGLGLSMVYGVMIQSKGYIRIASVVGKGTSIILYLPKIDAVPNDQHVRQVKARGHGEQVLVVEDEPMVLSLERRVLETAGYVVHSATTGEEALAFLNSHSGKIDLILSDIVMPRLNGRQLVERLDVEYPRIPVLLMSGYMGDDIANRGMMPKGTPFVQKPFTPDVLLKAVEEVLQKAKARALPVSE